MHTGINLDRRFTKWLREHQKEWQEGCWCARCVAISEQNEGLLRGMFIRELIQSDAVVETHQLILGIPESAASPGVQSAARHSGRSSRP